MKILKSILFSLHLQVAVNLVFVLLLISGIGPSTFRVNGFENHLIWMTLFSIIYFGISVLLFRFKPDLLKLPSKSLILTLILFILYTLSFALAQNDPNQWRILWLSHLPLGWLMRSDLASSLDLNLQLSFIVAILSPGLGLKGAEWLSLKLQSISKKAR